MLSDQFILGSVSFQEHFGRIMSMIDVFRAGDHHSTESSAVPVQVL